MNFSRFFATAPPLTFEEKEENKLGRGGYGAVYRGTFEGKEVAVKVIVKVHFDNKGKQEQKREMEEHLQLDHENVLKLLHVDDSRNKTCLVLELCAGTLTDYCEKKYKEPELPPDGIVLYQIANGLHYIHSQNVVHRDVKPDNILISITTPVQMKLSDFGFVKKTSPRGTFTQQSGLKGTLHWMAPEILELLNHSRDSTSEELPHGTIQSDTFAAGCVFIYFLTRGKHPFGSNSLKIPGNILDNNPIELNQHKQNLQGDDRALYELIGKMINPIGQRISLPEVIQQLTTNLTALRQFKRVTRLVRERGGKCVSRFHPKKLVLACGIKNEIIFFSAENWSIPFSNWKEDEKIFLIGHVKEITTTEWNVDGTQLAAITDEDVIVCWSYPSGEILFQKKMLKEPIDQIKWNPHRPNVFATFKKRFRSRKIVVFNSCPADQRSFHFYTIERENEITSFQWISANRVALGLWVDGGIEIWEIDESMTCAKIVKRLEYESDTIFDMAWDEQTKCLAACSHFGLMTIWSMDSDQPIHNTKVDGYACHSFAWRPNGKQTDEEGVDVARKSADNFILVGGSWDERIVIWTPLAEEKTRFPSRPFYYQRRFSSWVDSLSFSPDGRFLASTDFDKKLIIWATEDWDPVYIDKKERLGGGQMATNGPFSWMSSSSTDVPDYKLFYGIDSSDGKVVVFENAPSASKKFQAKIEDHETR